MKIDKNLKYATFSYDEADKTFTIYTHNDQGWIEGVGENPQKVTLNKVYSFAFMRFVIRIAQRNWLRTKKIVDKPSEGVLDLPEVEAEAVEELQQSLMFEDHEPELPKVH